MPTIAVAKVVSKHGFPGGRFRVVADLVVDGVLQPGALYTYNPDDPYCAPELKRAFDRAPLDGPWIEPELPAPVPETITPLQARKGLRAWGIGKDEIAGFFATIADAEVREDAEDAWEYATVIRIDDPLILGCARFLDKSPADVEQFFRDASRL